MPCSDDYFNDTTEVLDGLVSVHFSQVAELLVTVIAYGKIKGSPLNVGCRKKGIGVAVGCRPVDVKPKLYPALFPASANAVP